MKKFLPAIPFLIIVFLSFFADKVYAADAVPDGGRVDCSQTRDPEFSSDRPYQASPCGDRPISYWCGNSVVVDLGSVEVPYCDSSNGQKTSCPANIHKDQKIDVDLTNVQMPILGNTQDTTNSVTATDSIDDATKMNQYLSWYLNGTLNKAEYGPTDPAKIADYSGPIQKIMPQVMLEAQRISTIKTTGTQVAQIGENDKTTGKTEPSNHNQIVVCAKKKIGIVLPSLLSNITGLGSIGFGPEVPIECYNQPDTKAQGDVYRLSDVGTSDDNWTGKTNPAQEVLNWISQNISKIAPGSSVLQTISNDVERWNLKIPPLPWDDGTGQPFESQIAYQKAYNEWRGQYCIYNPLTNNQTLICTGNLWGILNNPYADLFPYIPLANTTDKKGAQMVTSTILQAPKATLENTSYELLHSPQLYIPHAVENSQLTDFLKSSYDPQDLLSTSGKSTSGDIPPDVENNNQCRIIPSSSNPGDDVTFDNPKSHIEVDVHYDVTEIECTNIKRKCAYINNPLSPNYGEDSCSYTATCKSTVYATVPSISKTPYADEIWYNTVAGSDSVFRRIYPKTGANAPVSCIADTPASSKATYTLNGNSSSGLELTRIIEPDGSGVSGGGGTNSIDAQLYYPHMGGILDYFLTGIQTALRPQGYGDPSPASGKYCTPVVPTSCQAGAVPDSSIPPKYLSSFKSNFIDLANRWAQGTGCEGASFNLADECYNYVVSESQKAGVNPAFALTIWLNETGASNYCVSGSTAQDFGINLPDIYQNITKQLAAFLNMAKMKLCAGTPGFPETMAGWLSRFQSSSGSCDPTDSTAMKYYEDVRDNTWNWVTGCSKSGRFGISWPTDMSCP